jgi:hypothetical protein
VTQAVDGSDRRLAVGHADVHVDPAVRRLAHQRPQALVDQLVALAAAQLDVGEARKRVQAGADERGDLAQLRAQGAEHADRLAGVVADRGT